ncbi:hypothetical protein [Bradyrhizobium japonicum]|uniref:hypothetical protein n=1 Tax=Bradyrhizobium japonicum TaxID=375 RepID=UPI001BA82289|nr:hypothetical protein [Bradyrhizobium japonicum]MBR0910633.1 hypothetical protein [Bradyrhizobium japonicum]
MTVDEDDAVDAMRIFANPAPGDAPIVSGERRAAGLAGLIRAANDQELRRALSLGPDSRVLLISTEGATDLEQYVKLTGSSPDQVSTRAQAPLPAS